MIVKTEILKGIASKILPAIDSSEISKISEVLELEVAGTILNISVTNKEYYVTTQLDLGYNEEFHVAVNASTFLNLVNQTTTEDMELVADIHCLNVMGNGRYKLPIIYDGDSMLTLPRIEITNPTVEMSIETSVLQSILKYNSKEIQKASIAQEVQKMYYVDENGAITFTTGACINEFKLEKPVKMLLSGKIVKLFRLFNGGKVNFVLGYDAISKEIIQTKVKFSDDSVSLTAILQCDDSMLRSVPVSKIVARAENVYPYSINITKNALIQAINRILILENEFGTTLKYAKFKFYEDRLEIMDEKENNVEKILYNNTEENLREKEYMARFDLNDLKTTLSSCDDMYLTLRFGDTQALVITRSNIFNVVPEIML